MIQIGSFICIADGGKPSAWRKKKGKATIRQFGALYEAELHWFEAHGIEEGEPYYYDAEAFVKTTMMQRPS
jgi:hypothetical protein